MNFLKQPHFATGVVVPPARNAPGAGLVGRALPQPSVTAHGRTTGLDAHLGSGWCVLRVFGSTIDVAPLDGTTASSVTVDAPWLGLTRPVGIVVRPDRYVAAVTEYGQEAAALRELKGLVPHLSATHAEATSPSPASA